MVDRRVLLTKEKFDQLPEYTASLPTWGKYDDGRLLGVAEWKRRVKEGWLMGKAALVDDDDVQIDWYIIDIEGSADV